MAQSCLSKMSLNLTSVRNMVHWAQLIQSGRFQMYDYGSTEKNEAAYGQGNPPQYDMGKFPSQVPVALVSGGKDLLADPADVQILRDQLKHAGAWPLALDVELEKYAHLDFLWHWRAAQDFYLPDIVPFLESRAEAHLPSVLLIPGASGSRFERYE